MQQTAEIHVAGQWRRAPLLGSMLALALIAAAAFVGHRQHRAPAEAGPPSVPTVTASGQGSLSAPGAAASETLDSAPVAISIRPAAPQPSSTRTSGQGLAWPLWEFQLRQPIPPRDPPLTPPTWRLVGATSSGASRSLIILRQGRSEPEYFRTGDTLPGGYVVGEITDEDVTLIHGQKSVLLSYIGTR